MSINAIVSEVRSNDDGSGELILTGEERGQPGLDFDAAPLDVALLAGEQVWGGSDSLLIGEKKIADRIGYCRIRFTVASIRDAMAEGLSIRKKYGRA